MERRGIPEMKKMVSGIPCYAIPETTIYEVTQQNLEHRV
jgi:hypothetical protein